MKVDNRNLTGASPSETGRTQDAQRAGRAGAAKPGSPEASADKAEVSTLAGRVSRALSTSNTQRAARVQELAALYQSGKYQPDSASIAHRLLSDALSAKKPE